MSAMNFDYLAVVRTKMMFALMK